MKLPQLFRLLTWASPAFPTGAFSYSHGLEFAVEERLVKNAAQLQDWVGWILRHGALYADAVLLAHAYRAADAGDNAKLDEVAALYRRGDLGPALPSMRLVGYRQAWQYLAGELDRPEMVRRAVVATRQLAKRQRTWFRSEPGIHWMDAASDPLSDAQAAIRDVAGLAQT